MQVESPVNERNEIKLHSQWLREIYFAQISTEQTKGLSTLRLWWRVYLITFTANIYVTNYKFTVTSLRFE